MEGNLPESASLTESNNPEKSENPAEPEKNNPADEGLITVLISKVLVLEYCFLSARVLQRIFDTSKIGDQLN